MKPKSRFHQRSTGGFRLRHGWSRGPALFELPQRDPVEGGHGGGRRVRPGHPRDRDGSFTPCWVPGGQRRLDDLDDLDVMMILLIAGGMTVRDIRHHLVATIGTELSWETISFMTDAVLDEVLEREKRHLAALIVNIVMASSTSWESGPHGLRARRSRPRLFRARHPRVKGLLIFC
ncbi:MAG: transposase [Cryobacterium sp.]|nr:transposase [Cryobacterium sp.]